jgi:hypothetical protein
MIFAPQVCRTELKKTEIGELMADINGKETWLGFGEMENGDRIWKWKFCHDGLLEQQTTPSPFYIISLQLNGAV